MRRTAGILIIFLLASAASAWAHGGHAPAAATDTPMAGMDHTGHGAAEGTGAPAGDTYGLSGGDTAPSGEKTPADGALAGSGLLDATPSAPPAPSGEHAGHAMPSMQHVTPSEHQAVASSSKGYGAAVGITLVVGLVFAGLCFVRPFE